MHALKLQNVYQSFGHDRKPLALCKWLERVLPAFLWTLLHRVIPQRWTEGTKENRVLRNINLEIGRGQIVALVGPSGCGKSTMLRAILGTHPPLEGTILAGDSLVKGPSRNIGIVYQHYSLYDHDTILGNVAVGPDWAEWNSITRIVYCLAYWKACKRYEKQASELLDKVGLGDHKDKYPSQLSGGQRQRVAICQALIMEPQILLLDEPFGALDEATREELQQVLLTLYQDNLEAKAEGKPAPYTILIVTHELNEAFYVSDRVLGLSQFHDGNSAGNGDYENKVGAMIVYDKAAPVYHPDDPKEFAAFNQQKEELREHVMQEQVLQHHREFVTFWTDHEKVHGVPSKK